MIDIIRYYANVYSDFFALGALYGMGLGIGLAFLITMILIKKSNEVGSTKGSLLDFGGLYMIESEDDLRHSKPSGNACAILSEHHKEEKEYYQNKKDSGDGLSEKPKLKKRRFGDGSIGEVKATRDIFKEKFGSQE